MLFRSDAINKKDELIVADLGGGTEHIAASLPHLSLDFGSISFSPDGLLLAFGDVVLFTDTQ